VTATPDQQDVIDHLTNPSTHDGASVERIDTHSAIVFLAGPRALKLKRAVRFDYLDFSTEARRRTACEAEVRVNRRTAPSLYRGVLAVTRGPDGSLALGGHGTPVDWVVEMARFDQNGLLDRLADREELDPDLMPALASAIARLHRTASRRTGRGGRDGMAWVVDGNTTGIATQGAGILDPALGDRLASLAGAAVDRHADLLDARRGAGFVRECHGDLHLRNIVRIDGAPVLFDAVEFNEAISCIDVLYDLAFLLMDLWRRGLTRHANAVWNAYLAATEDLSGLALLPLFLSCRAAVRAKTSATAARMQPDRARAGELETLARQYLAMAVELLEPAPARLVAVGGLSGSGKSTLARALAPEVPPVPGAVVLRSDEIRKALLGVGPLQRLGAEGYTPQVTEAVYRALGERAATAVRAGQSVIADAVFSRPAERAAMEAAATSTAVPFTGLWLDAPADVLTARAGARRMDASDADADVVRQQLARDPGPVTWQQIEASDGPEAVLERTRARLRPSAR
jgi:aminoglycoside phosphotransferase family enzyme/predicted kinase